MPTRVIHRDCGGKCEPVYATSDVEEAFWPECENCGIVPDHETVRQDD